MEVDKRQGDSRGKDADRLRLTLDPESKDEAKLRSKIAELEKLQQARQTPH